MNTFLKRLSVFVILLILYFGLSFLTNKIILNNSSVIDKEEINILINGDSHMEVSLNPDYFKSAINISQGGENVILSYWKLKYILKKVKIDTLIMSLSYNNISINENNKFFNNSMTPEVMRRTILTNEFETIDSILKIDYKEYYKAYFRHMCLYPTTNQYTFIGGFSPSEYSNLLPNVDKRIKKHYFNKKNEVAVSEIIISYVDSIVNLCKKNKTTPIFVTTPLHKSYFEKIPQPIKERFEEEKKKLSEKNVKTFDFSEVYFEDELYYDCDHLNSKGAEKFSKLFVKSLKEDF